MFKFKNVWLRISIITGTVAILFYSSEPTIYGDSSRYLEPSLRGSILYSFIIDTLTLIFGSITAVVVFQTFLIGFAIIYFIETISDYFDFDNLIKVIIVLFLFLPILKFYRNILTEAITYAITIFFVSSVINLIYNFKLRNLVKVSIFTLLLLISKKQFLFLIPVVFVTYFGIFLMNKTKSVFFFLIISFLSILALNIVISNFDKYIKINFLEINTSSVSYGKGGPYYFTYIDAIYISSTEDYKLFSNPKLKQVLKKIFNEMDKQEALMEYYNGRGHYGLSFNKIRIFSDNLIQDLAIQEKTAIKNLQKNITFKLIKANLGEYIQHIFKKFYDSTWIFIFVPFFMLIGSSLNFFRHKSKLSLLIIFVSLHSLANHTLVYLFGRVQPRYLINSDLILITFIFILTFIFLSQKDIKKLKLF